MVVTAYALVQIRSLFAVAMMSGIYSLLAASLYLVMDAVDVAFTEAAVGAGISTVLMLGTLALTTRMEKVTHKPGLTPLLIVVATGALLIYATFDMPPYGDPAAPIHNGVSARFIERSGEEVGPPNIVTSVLASYRGYDTLGEVTVIFTAAVGVMALIGRGRSRRRKKSDDPEAPNT
jgi:multicomponent Na+:H+ antiporter subunit B